MNKWIIKCWTGRILFNGKKFDSFEDGEDHLERFFEREALDYAIERQEYYIEELSFGEELLS